MDVFCQLVADVLQVRRKNYLQRGKIIREFTFPVRVESECLMLEDYSRTLGKKLKMLRRKVKSEQLTSEEKQEKKCKIVAICWKIAKQLN